MASAARRFAPATLFATAAALLTVASAVGQSLDAKRSEAEAVLAQIRTIDTEVARAAESWNLANIQLAEIGERRKANGRMLVVARQNLASAQRNLHARLVAIYTGYCESDKSIEVLIGATSIEDLFDRLDAVERVSEQDAHVLKQVRTFRTQVERRRAELARAHKRQTTIVARRAAQRAAIEAKLAERQRLLSSIRSEIERLEAAERARQALLERQARARVLAQQAQASEVAAQPEAEPSFTAEAVVGPAPSEAPPPARYGGVVGIAMQYLGTPYVWGGASPSGFDCSGFIMYVYAQLGISLPHNAAAQYGYGTPVSRDQLQAGDLVFFNGLGHNGIYIGGGQFIHSPHTGDVVKISSLSDSWYAATWVGARRL